MLRKILLLVGVLILLSTALIWVSYWRDISRHGVCSKNLRLSAGHV